MSFTQEFKDFIMRGNVVDLAVGVVIGGAFGKIVTSFVDNIIMPVVGFLTGGMDFSQMKLVLKAGDEAAKLPEVAIKYGSFVNEIVSFVIIAFAIFIMIKAINKVKRPKEDVAVEVMTTESILCEIRDLLKK